MARSGHSLALLLLLPMLTLSACRQSEPLGKLRFPDGPGAAAADSGVAGEEDPSPRFAPELLRPVVFVARYSLATGRGVTRLEELRLTWDAAGGAQRVQKITFQAPGEPVVDRQNEDLLQDGVQLTRGGDGSYLRHPEPDDWAEKLEQDLGGWRALAQALGLELQPGEDALPLAGRDALRRELTGRQAGASGELWLDARSGTLLQVRLQAGGGAQHVRYEAALERIGDPALAALPRVPPEQIRSPDRPRSYARIKEHLQEVGIDQAAR